MAEHTPGPWEAHDFDNGEISIVHQVEDGTSEIAVVQLDEYGDQWDDIRRADARLIAAAPDLLEAILDIRSFLRSRGYDTRIVDAVIAKAEGREVAS